VLKSEFISKSNIFRCVCVFLTQLTGHLSTEAEPGGHFGK